MAPSAAQSQANGFPTDRAAAGERAFDSAKVARMSRAIAERSFRIDAEAIADRLLLNARRLTDQAAVRRSGASALS